jgi:two-component system nitrogen regulation sensor histidine kinase NtrY
MVDEFSGFARMPAPTFGDEEIIEIIRQTTLFLEVSSPQVQFKLNLPKAPLMIYCDGRLLAQALTNIIQNAVEAIGSTAGGNATSRDAKIEISVETGDEKTIIKVSDNGCGLPAELRDRLTEPYVTTRAKGTGLGLAIVRKIMSDHGGELVIEDGPSNGAVVKLVFSNERLDELRASQDAVGRDASLSVTSIG